jgi:hypothetical protein
MTSSPSSARVLDKQPSARCTQASQPLASAVPISSKRGAPFPSGPDPR